MSALLLLYSNNAFSPMLVYIFFSFFLPNFIPCLKRKRSSMKLCKVSEDQYNFIRNNTIVRKAASNQALPAWLNLEVFLQVLSKRTLLQQCVLDRSWQSLLFGCQMDPCFPHTLAQLRPRLFSLFFPPQKKSALAERKPQLNFMVLLLLPSWF